MNKTDIDFRIYKDLIEKIDNELTGERPLILAIDGMCGSGKTTLAEYLTSVYNVSVIHMDHFFLPLIRKTPERLAEPGGNIDYERFMKIVIPALKNRETFHYMAYNCQTKEYDREIEVQDCDLIIVEGSYCLHEKFENYFDISVFLMVSEEEQFDRLKRRCGEGKKLQLFKNQWIPMETLYHKNQQVKKRCHFIIDTSTV